MIINVLRSEWAKVYSVRSTWNILGVIIALVLLMTFLAWHGVQGWDDLSPEQRVRFEAPPLEMIVLPFLQLCVAALGVLAITSEYSTGTIQSSLTVAPRRLVLLMSKAGVILLIALIVGLAIPIVTHDLARLIVGNRPAFPGYETLASYETPMLLGLSLSVVAAAMVGLGLGTALRTASGALLAMVALVFVLPTLAHTLPGAWGVWINSMTLSSLPVQLSGQMPSDSIFSPFEALAVMVAYAAASLGAGAFVLIRTDA